MLYELLVPLAKYHTAFNVFRYITFRTAMATVTALVISFILGPWLITRLREMQHVGSSVREDTPERHQKTKAGTPTMGGIGILVAILVSTLLWANLRTRYVWVLVLATGGLGLIGLVGRHGLAIVPRRIIVRLRRGDSRERAAKHLGTQQRPLPRRGQRIAPE